MSARKKILVVDDERHIVEFLVMNLRQNQYDSAVAYDGLDALAQAALTRPDLILLDSMLPGMSGTETCRMLRQDEKTRHIPIIFLTAKSEESDKVLGLSLGADDYITKPFGLRELFARIEAVLRRSAGRTPAVPESMMRLQDLTIDTDRFCVDRGEERISLSPTEFSLLVLLARNGDRVIPRAEVLASLDPARGSAEGRALDVHLRNLRKKLGASPGIREYIDTVRGVGLKANP